MINEKYVKYSRYQWSVGYLSGATPLGVFNGVTERVWHDAGQRTDIVFTTKPGKTQVQGKFKSPQLKLMSNLRTMRI